MSVKPSISVVIPTYNYGRVLPRAVGSVIAQLSECVELLVVDDGSTDDTQDVLAKLHGEHAGQFSSFKKENGGVASARNFSLQHIKAEYILFLDADDELLPGALDLIRQNLDDNRDVHFFIAGHYSLSADGKKRKILPPALPAKSEDRLKQYLLEKSISIAPSHCVIHRDILQEHDFPENYRNSEDVPVFAQALANFNCGVIPEAIVIMHKHDDSLRHNLKHSKSVGVDVVDEIFSSGRLNGDYEWLKKAFYVKRCLSLAKMAVAKGDKSMAKSFYVQAIRQDWTVVFHVQHLKRMVRLLF